MKLIACDLDGTLLLRGEEKLHRLIASEIEKILENNYIFCVASGRNYSELKRLLKDFENKIYFIANDGALIVNKGENIFEAPIDKESLKLIDNEKNIVLHGKYLTFVESDSERFVRHIKEQYFGHTVRIDSLDEVNEPIYKITLYGKKDDISDLDRVYCDKLMCEYVKSGINKGKALETLLNNLKINRADAAAVGDGLNDEEMFKLTGKSYVIASAPPKLKKIGTYIVNDFKDAADNLLKE